MSDYLFNNIITDFAPIAFLALAVFAASSYQWILQRMPEKQQAALKEFTDMAVKHTEQIYKLMSPEMKKDAAMQLTETLFQAFKRPVPNSKAISTAIEAAVFNLPDTYTAEEKDENPLAPLSIGKLDTEDHHA